MLAEREPATSVPATAVPWWKGAAIYQIYPRSFMDSNGDGIGDLPGILGKLDYVSSLGVDAIWLSPFFTSPMQDFGYDVADYRGVDPIFGSLEDFDRIVERAHELNLKVLIDQVYSHTSDEHSWFQESRSSRTGPKSDWYVWADAKPDGSPPNNWQSVFGGPAWTWDARRSQYYFHNFLAEQPGLNVHNPDVQQALLDVAAFWLDRGVDGFRLDAINFAMHDPELRDNPPAPPGKRSRPFDFQQHLYNQSHPDIVKFLERMRTLTDSYGDRFTVAEVGGDDALDEMQAFTAGNSRLNSAYGFNFLYADKLTPALVATVAEDWPEDAGWPSWAFENHDAPRAVSRWGDEEHLPLIARLKMLLLCSLRGSVILYQGEELGLPQVDVPFDQLRDPEAIANWPQTLSRDGARTPMPWSSGSTNLGFSNARPWLPIGTSHLDLAVDRQEGDNGSMLSFTRHCLDLRNRHAALHHGAMRIGRVTEHLLVFEREAGGETLRCSFNLSAQASELAEEPGTPIVAVGEVKGTSLGPWSAVIEKLV